LANTKFKVETDARVPLVFCPKKPKKTTLHELLLGYVGYVGSAADDCRLWVAFLNFCSIVILVMALTKVSSTVHFVSRGATVGGRGGAVNGHWVPNTDVYATDNGLVVKVEMAGMKSDTLEITVEGNRLRIAGDRPDGCRANKCNFLVMEISYGPFESVLELPPVMI